MSSTSTPQEADVRAPEVVPAKEQVTSKVSAEVLSGSTVNERADLLRQVSSDFVRSDENAISFSSSLTGNNLYGGDWVDRLTPSGPLPPDGGRPVFDGPSGGTADAPAAGDSTRTDMPTKKVPEDPELTAARASLDTLSEGKLTDSDLFFFQNDMRRLESRAVREGIPPAEVAKTFREVSRLFEQEGNQGLTEAQRINLARQVMEQAAEPTRVQQGAFGTCLPASVEVRTYQLAPAEAARLVADVALTGAFTARDGTVVETTAGPKSAQARNYPPRVDGVRTHASEIFQITATNLAHQLAGTGRRYDQVELAPPQSLSDDGERLYQAGTTTEIMDGDKPKRAVNLDEGQALVAERILTGRTDQIYIAAQSYYSDKGDAVTRIGSEEELHEVLAAAKANGQFPAGLRVNTQVEPWWADSGRGLAGGSGGAHAVTITDYDPETRQVSIDNQWSQLDDRHYGDRRLGIHDLYITMQSDYLAKNLLQADVTASRSTGALDDGLEFNLLNLHAQDLRLLYPIMHKSDSLRDPLLSFVNYANGVWSDVPPDTHTRHRISDSARQIAQNLPLGARLPVLQEMHDSGFLDTSLLGISLSQSVSDFGAMRDKLSLGPSPNPDETPNAYADSVALFTRLAQHLPEAERNRILALIQTEGTAE